MKAASQPAETVAQKQNRTATVPQDFQMNILDGLDACVYISDMETNELLFVNRRTKDTFGLNDSVVGQPCCQVFGDGANTTCGFCPVEQLAQQPATPVVWEQKSTIDGKTYRNVDSVITWVNGKQAHMRQATDITGMMQAQQEAHEARDRLEIALMASHAGVWDLDLQAGTFTYDKWCGKLLGLRPVSGTISAQKLASHFDKIMQSDGGAEVKQALRTQDQNAEWPVRDSKLVFPDGQVRYIRSYGTTERDNAGQTVRVIGMNMDITQSVTLENELKAAKTAAVKQGHADADERTQVMLDATPLAASFWDEEGNMLDCNMEAVRLFGLSGKAEYIEHFYDLNPEYQPDGMSTAEKASAEIAAAFKTGYRRFEWMYLTVDGQPLPVETILVRVPWRGEYRLAA